MIIKVTTTGICGLTCTSTRSSARTWRRRHPRPRAHGHRARRWARLSGLCRRRPGGVPFQISCGGASCATPGSTTQCETTQVREEGTGAALFGYSKLYGSVPGGQAEYLRVPYAQNTTNQGARGSAGRSVRVPLGRPADGVAGRPVRRRARRAGRSPCSGSGRSATWPPGSPSTRAAGHRRGPRRRAAASGPGRGAETSTSGHDDDLADAIRASPTGAAPTR